jgi:CRISPR/Cas system CSM-associated protein Csm3 (group 7 of RAMP superfamily)
MWIKVKLMPQDRHVITGKVLFSATLHLESPLLMGKGDGEWVDKEVMRLPDGRPYIPASSFAGSLRSLMESEGLVMEGEDWLWGSPVGKDISPTPGGDKQSYQSHLIVHDLLPAEGSEGATVVKRDGVRINHASNTAESGKKYDYEVVERGACFSLVAELTIRSAFGTGNDEQVEDLGRRIMGAMHHVRFRLGAFTSQGFGKLKVKEPDVRFFRFPDDSETWFRYLETAKLPDDVRQIKPAEGWVQTGDYPFSVIARFRIKSALMVGAPGDKRSRADKSYISSKGRYILPGKSIRGALRHRARRILGIIMNGGNGDTGRDLTRELFGFVDEGGDRDGNSAKGRILVEETVIEEATVKPMLQDRIRIDRFTGGVIDTGLFNSEPIWTTGGESIEIAMHILRDATSTDRKLLLMLLKDLWTGDLPIGGEKNVGRGVLMGLEASVIEFGKPIARFKRRDGSMDSAKIEVEFGAQTLERIMDTEQTASYGTQG